MLQGSAMDIPLKDRFNLPKVHKLVRPFGCGQPKQSKRLEEMDEAVDVSKLSAVVRAVRETGDIAGKITNAERQVGETQDRVDRLLSSLHPNVTDEKTVIEMQVAPRAGVQNHRDQLQDWERRVREKKQQIDGVERELDLARQSFERTVSDELAVTTDELEDVRVRRNSLWELVKIKHIEDGHIPDEKRSA